MKASAKSKLCHVGKVLLLLLLLLVVGLLLLRLAKGRCPPFGRRHREQTIMCLLPMVVAAPADVVCMVGRGGG